MKRLTTSSQKENRRHTTIEKQWKSCSLSTWRSGILCAGMYLRFNSCICLQYATLFWKCLHSFLEEKILRNLVQYCPKCIFFLTNMEWQFNSIFFCLYICRGGLIRVKGCKTKFLYLLMGDNDRERQICLWERSSKVLVWKSFLWLLPDAVGAWKRTSEEDLIGQVGSYGSKLSIKYAGPKHTWI